jgi:hypothetical protein
MLKYDGCRYEDSHPATIAVFPTGTPCVKEDRVYLECGAPSPSVHDPPEKITLQDGVRVMQMSKYFCKDMPWLDSDEKRKMRTIDVDFDQHELFVVGGCVMADMSQQSHTLQAVMAEAFKKSVRTVCGNDEMNSSSAHRVQVSGRTVCQASDDLGYHKLAYNIELGHNLIDGHSTVTNSVGFGYEGRTDDTSKRMQHPAHLDNDAKKGNKKTVCSAEQRGVFLQSSGSFCWDRIIIKIKMPHSGEHGEPNTEPLLTFMLQLDSGECVILRFTSPAVGIVASKQYFETHRHGATGCSCPSPHLNRCVCSATFFMDTCGALSGPERLLCLKRDANDKTLTEVIPRVYHIPEWGENEDYIRRQKYFADYVLAVYRAEGPVLVLSEFDVGTGVMERSMADIVVWTTWEYGRLILDFEVGGLKNELFRRLGSCMCCRRRQELEYKLPEALLFEKMDSNTASTSKVFFMQGRQYRKIIKHKSGCESKVNVMYFYDAPRRLGSAFITGDPRLLAEATIVARAIIDTGSLSCVAGDRVPLHETTRTVRHTIDELVKISTGPVIPSPAAIPPLPPSPSRAQKDNVDDNDSTPGLTCQVCQEMMTFDQSFSTCWVCGGAVHSECTHTQDDTLTVTCNSCRPVSVSRRGSAADVDISELHDVDLSLFYSSDTKGVVDEMIVDHTALHGVDEQDEQARAEERLAAVLKLHAVLVQKYLLYR